ncbi:SPOR domain-containing protein [Diaphorobacter sp. JS3051]|uniref:SPOR domain-containing protein n=1 Tax=Diaphorobacter sp. JS3051 TaxID=2792224 RepID=UPI0018CBB71D|nr:SPOR domain-containing protein [Diaphorobacter sp. JS3051]QPN29989.1 SPOR domain-containing protein [Diaphorobacter sp. JS3051]
MLRLAVVLLLLANAGYYAWSQGLLRGWGLAPVDESEPQRMEQQIAPQNLRLLPQGSKGAASSAAPAGPASSPATVAAPAEPPACLQAGVFDARQADALRRAAAVLPEGSWTLEPTPITGRWMVYMGRFPDEEAVAKKRAELRALKIPYDRPGAALEPGLSLGRFSTEEAAQRGMALLANQGVRTARVVQERADAPGFMLRLPAVNDTLRTRLDTTLQPALAGKTLRPCA